MLERMKECGDAICPEFDAASSVDINLEKNHINIFEHAAVFRDVVRFSGAILISLSQGSTSVFSVWLHHAGISKSRGVSVCKSQIR